MAFKNEKPFSHTCSHGTAFSGDRCDLRGGVNVVKPDGISEIELIADAAQFAAWHALCIREDLNGFSGYDTIQYNITN